MSGDENIINLEINITVNGIPMVQDMVNEYIAQSREYYMEEKRKQDSYDKFMKRYYMVNSI